MMYDTEAIREANDIVEVVSRFTELKKEGKEFKGLCPIHSENDPSFGVNQPEKKWYCHGCSDGGDVIKFMQRVNNITFNEACEQLGGDRLNETERPSRRRSEPKPISPEDAKKQADGVARARKIWDEQCVHANSNGYAIKKKIGMHSSRIFTGSMKIREMDCHGAMVIPLFDESMDLASLQFIDNAGEKRFLYGPSIAKAFHCVGEISHGSPLAICEGFATAASLHEATGITSIVALSAGGIMDAARLFKSRGHQIFICADDDQKKGNVGLNAAKSAADVVGGSVFVPDFGPDRQAGWKDANDLSVNLGASELKRQWDLFMAEEYASENQEIMLTEIGLSDLFVARNSTDAIYCKPFKQWYLWDENLWVPDVAGSITERSIDAIRSLQFGSGKQAKFSFKSEKSSVVFNMIRLAESRLKVLPEQLDQNNMIIAFKNGTIDLSTGKLKPSDRKDYITKRINITYNEDALCPTWEQFLREIFQDDYQMLDFIQRMVGYAMTGIIKEHKLFFFYGKGRNGKSTFMKILKDLSGDYYGMLNSSAIMKRKIENSDTSQFAALRGTRIVGVSEIGENDRLEEALIKSLTGGDPITARMLYANQFTYDPTFKLFLCGNYKPKITGTDEGIWGRILQILFGVSFLKEDCDPGLYDKLKKETQGILAWAVRGSVEWQKSGLNPPASVLEASEEYRQDQDQVARFIEDRCALGTGDDYWVAFSILYQAYVAWCVSEGESFKESSRGFTLKLSAKQLGRGQSKVDGKNSKILTGIKLV